MNLPVDFINRMKEYLGEETESFLASYSCAEVKSLRINTLKTERTYYDEPDLLGRVPWEERGYYYNTDKVSPGKNPLHEAGAYYIQEASAMSPVKALSVEPGDRVLDLCASPGGKSTQIGAYLKGEGILISNEIVGKRAKILSENIERMGIRNALVISEDPRNISDKFAGYFDKILVDAPCSGEGMFRRSEEAINEWSLENVKMCVERQSWILDEAYKMLAPGGRLVYSTCTFSKEENEENALAFADRHSDVEVKDISDTFFTDDFTIENSGLSHGYDNVGYRLWPHKVNGEGHYFCIFEKKGSVPNAKSAPVYGYEKGINGKDIGIKKDVCELLNGILSSDILLENKTLVKFGDQIYMIPDECPNLKGIKVLRPGLHIATINKNRLEPAHSLAVALLKNECKNICDLSLDNNVIYKYINGETFNFDGSGNGWYLIMIEGCSIGWGKLAGAIMKNHFPKGLRKSLS